MRGYFSDADFFENFLDGGFFSAFSVNFLEGSFFHEGLTLGGARGRLPLTVASSTRGYFSDADFFENFLDGGFFSAFSANFLDSGFFDEFLGARGPLPLIGGGEL